MNFQTVLEELDRLYEESTATKTQWFAYEKAAGVSKNAAASGDFKKFTDEQEAVKFAKENGWKAVCRYDDLGSDNDTVNAEETIVYSESLCEDSDEEVLMDDEPIIDDEAEEVFTDDGAESEEEVEVEEEAPKQLVLECSKCGALILKDETDVQVDEGTDLANVEEECKFCEEAKGYKVVGTLAPYEAEEELEEFLDVDMPITANVGIEANGNSVPVLNAGVV